MLATLLLLVALLIETTDDALAPWAPNHHPTDVARQEIHEITKGRDLYAVVQAGTMDGRNRGSPQGVWRPFEHTWESNRSVVMENVGLTDVVSVESDQRRPDQDALGWGIEKVVTSGTATVGTAAQSFVIDVGPGPNSSDRE